MTYLREREVTHKNNILKYQARLFSDNQITRNSSWASKANALTGAKYAFWASKGLGIFNIPATIYEARSDGHFSAGDGVKVDLSSFSVFGGPFGMINGIIDLGFAIFFGTSLADRIGQMVDEEMQK